MKPVWGCFPQWFRHRANIMLSRMQMCDSVWTCSCHNSCLDVGWSQISTWQVCCTMRTVVQNVCVHLSALHHTCSVHCIWSWMMSDAHDVLNLGWDGPNFKFPPKQDCGLAKHYYKCHLIWVHVSLISPSVHCVFLHFTSPWPQLGRRTINAYWFDHFGGVTITHNKAAWLADYEYLL